jgi:hypothetical protein
LRPFQAGETGGGKCDLELIALELLAERCSAVRANDDEDELSQLRFLRVKHSIDSLGTKPPGLISHQRASSARTVRTPKTTRISFLSVAWKRTVSVGFPPINSAGIA